MTVAAPPRRTGSRSSRARSARPEPQTLGVALDWVPVHCIIPDGFRRHEPLALYDWQTRFLGNHYLVRPDAPWVPANPVLAPAFLYRRSGMVGPQKLGKDPMEAAQICLEGVGPALFAGFAGRDEGYACADHGCGCGWEYPYSVGEPRGMRWPTPLIQITAVSEDATQNTYDALRPMIDDGPLHDLIPRTSESFIRIGRSGRIDTVTASGRSRLGQRVTFVSQGEAGLYTRANGMLGPNGVADTQNRGLAGMGARAVWHTNAWDPSEGSYAQREHEHPSPDVHIQFDRPPAGLSMTRKDDRWRIYRLVYPADVRRENGGHLDLDSIDAEAVGILAHDPAQAARFFGNQIVTGSGKAFDPAVWAGRADPGHAVPDGALVVIGFDGSKTGDHTAAIATEVLTGFQWPLGIWEPAVVLAEGAPPEVDRGAVDDAIAAAFATYSVWRMYVDPPYWKDELASWAGRFGDKVVVRWETYRNRPMGFAVRGFAQAIADRTLTHSGHEAFARHIGNASRKPLSERDDKGAPLWTIQKDTPDSAQKVDAAVAAVLSWEARTDAIASGATAEQRRTVDVGDLHIYHA